MTPLDLVPYERRTLSVCLAAVSVLGSSLKDVPDEHKTLRCV